MSQTLLCIECRRPLIVGDGAEICIDCDPHIAETDPEGVRKPCPECAAGVALNHREHESTECERCGDEGPLNADGLCETCHGPCERCQTIADLDKDTGFCGTCLTYYQSSVIL